MTDFRRGGSVTDAVIETRGLRRPAVGRNICDGGVEANVGIFPGQKPSKLFPESGIAFHDVIRGGGRRVL